MTLSVALANAVGAACLIDGRVVRTVPLIAVHQRAFRPSSPTFVHVRPRYARERDRSCSGTGKYVGRAHAHVHAEVVSFARDPRDPDLVLSSTRESSSLEAREEERHA